MMITRRYPQDIAESAAGYTMWGDEIVSKAVHPANANARSTLGIRVHPRSGLVLPLGYSGWLDNEGSILSPSDLP
jgi:hypothetical protein